MGRLKFGEPAQKAFLLQAGDCAESFTSFSAESVKRRLQVILQMAVVLTYSSGVPTVKIGRIAGQFAKPRSSPTETVEGLELPSFRGHIVNDPAPLAEARVPDPNRLVRAYHQALCWDIGGAQPWSKLTRAADRVLTPVIGKSLVIYARKTETAAS